MSTPKAAALKKVTADRSMIRCRGPSAVAFWSLSSSSGAVNESTSPAAAHTTVPARGEFRVTVGSAAVAMYPCLLPANLLVMAVAFHAARPSARLTVLRFNASDAQLRRDKIVHIAIAPLSVGRS